MGIPFFLPFYQKTFHICFCTEEEPSLKSCFLALSVCKNESKIQNTAILLVDIQIWIHFYAQDKDD